MGGGQGGGWQGRAGKGGGGGKGKERAGGGMRVSIAQMHTVDTHHDETL